MNLFILKVGPSEYVGGPMTATGYGTTRTQSMAICFDTPKEAGAWMERHGVAAAVVECGAVQCAF